MKKRVWIFILGAVLIAGFSATSFAKAPAKGHAGKGRQTTKKAAPGKGPGKAPGKYPGMMQGKGAHKCPLSGLGMKPGKGPKGGPGMGDKAPGMRMQGMGEMREVMGLVMIGKFVENPQFKKKLGITDDQAEKIKSGTKTAFDSMKQAGEKNKALRKDLAGLLKADKPDKTQINAKIDEIAGITTSNIKEMVGLAMDIKAALTPDQLAKLKKMGEKMGMQRGGPQQERGWRGEQGRRGGQGWRNGDRRKGANSRWSGGRHGRKGGRGSRGGQGRRGGNGK